MLQGNHRNVDQDSGQSHGRRTVHVDRGLTLQHGSVGVGVKEFGILHPSVRDNGVEDDALPREGSGSIRGDIEVLAADDQAEYHRVDPLLVVDAAPAIDQLDLAPQTLPDLLRVRELDRTRRHEVGLRRVRVAQFLQIRPQPGKGRRFSESSSEIFRRVQGRGSRIWPGAAPTWIRDGRQELGRGLARILYEAKFLKIRLCFSNRTKEDLVTRVQEDDLVEMPGDALRRLVQRSQRRLLRNIREFTQGLNEIQRRRRVQPARAIIEALHRRTRRQDLRY